MEAKSKYLEDNKDFLAFINALSTHTSEMLTKVWLNNIRENRELFSKTGWATVNLQDKEQGRTAIIIGASPALEKQIETLKEIQYHNDFILCGLSCNLEFLLNNGIQPKYCITVDADSSQGEFWKDIDMDKTRDITLLTSTLAYPPMLKEWKGPMHFFVLGGENAKVTQKHRKWYRPINGNGQEFPSLMGQFNVMTVFAFLVFGCQIILFVGNELSYEKKESRYYVDRDDPRDFDDKKPHGDIYGNTVYTTFGLLALKLALEMFLELISGAGWFINCSEAGIFGVTKRFPDRKVPWIQQMTLKNGIAQARHIMRTGEPFYEYSKDSVVTVPDISHNLNLQNLKFA